jgi:glycosyltransferase involved in cell wall biosynthesis
MNKWKVVVAHHSRQHSGQLAVALDESNMLASYLTGVPANRSTALSRIIFKLINYEILSIPAKKVRHFFWPLVLHKIANESLSPAKSVKWLRWTDTLFDRWCAKQVVRLQADAVVCYENAARLTFRRAEKYGIVKILDAASFHYKWQDRFYDYPEPEEVHKAITRRKDKEIALADHIFTVSDLARQSYLDSGVPAEKVTAIPLGCDLERFKLPSRSLDPDSLFTFIFVGSGGRLKGLDVLLQASMQIHAEFPHRVVLVGDARESFRWSKFTWIERRGRVPQQQLSELYQKADCLILPSRVDSFAMVVVEAMATGLPVILSDHVGAKEAIDEGVNGWVVPAEDTESLAYRMRWCIKNDNEVRAMKLAARGAAERYSWESYRQRVVKHVQKVISQQKGLTS